jgi:hypothetical protein
MNVLKNLALISAVLAASVSTYAGATGTETVRSISAVDIDNTRHVLPVPGRRATVVLFIAHDCPIANLYAPEYRRIVDAYSRKGVAFFVAYAEPHVSIADARRHVHEYRYDCPAVVRDAIPLAHKLGATVTPEVAEILPSGAIAYRGRIDNWVATFGVTRKTASEHYLRDALDSTLAGKSVARPRTPAIGCYIVN